MFKDSAFVYDALCRHKDYAAASEVLRRTIRRAAPHARTLLDLGCGTGLHLSHLQQTFEVEGLDASCEMLEIARERCPDVTFHHASLIDFHIARSFDVITCLFGSIAYTATRAHLSSALRRMASHLTARGVIIVEPWVPPDRFVDGKLVFDRIDDPELKVARMYVQRREGTIAVLESDYLVATSQGVRHFTERQELGLFSDEDYRQAFEDAGLSVVDSSGDLFGYGLYACRFARDPVNPNG